MTNQTETIKQQLLAQLERLPAEQREALKKKIEAASPEELEAFLKIIRKECLFCQLAAGKLQTVKIYEDQELLAVLDAYPATKGQLLVFPRAHIPKLEELPEQLLYKLWSFVKLILPVLLKKVQTDSASIYVAQGELAGQRIDHFYISLIPRFKEDKVVINWERNEASKEELEKLGKEISEEAQALVKAKLEAEAKQIAEEKAKAEAAEAEAILKHIKERLP